MSSRRLLELLERAVRRSPADQTLMACERGIRTTLRFSHQRIHQNFHSENIDVWIKVICNGCVGVATTNSLDAAALRKATEAAIATAKTGRRKRGNLLPDPGKKTPARLTTYIPKTARQDVGDTTRAIAKAWQRAERLKYNLAGSFHSGHDELAVAGSNGIARYQPFTTAGIKVIAAAGKASGYSASVHRDIGRIDIQETTGRALALAEQNRRPRDVPVGVYDCILEPEAVAELLEWLGYIGLGAKSLYEKTSFLSGRAGDRIMGNNITLSDDAGHPEGLQVPFDYEGVAKQRVVLIERGAALGVVYDTTYGKIYRRESTGHGAPYDDTEGPLPMHLTLAAGSAPRSQMERLLGNGLVVTRFHYVNGLLGTRQALMTGLTRDGTFLVKKGRRAGSVKNLRFTESILEAFSRVAEISKERRLVADPTSGLQSCLAPALLIRGVHFTGKTQ
ncbi:MAG: TldD/PmbA family protein [Candidatus Omnitrophica bacterium]|nr:TldD/PmbA family protein [Candidatus Omnitrophota bacterium]